MELINKAQLLSRFIDEWRDRPVVWGESDCTAFAAEWVKVITGKRVPFLADYACREEAHRLIAHYGGLSYIWAHALSNVGVYEQLSCPQIGDVGIIELSDYGQVGVIIGNDRVSILRTENGTRFLRPRTFVKVWSI